MHYRVSNCWMLPVEDMRLFPCIQNAEHSLQQSCLTLCLSCWFFITVQVEAASVAGGASPSLITCCLSCSCLHAPSSHSYCCSKYLLLKSEFMFCKPTAGAPVTAPISGCLSIMFPLSPWLHTFCSLYKIAIFLPFID